MAHILAKIGGAKVDDVKDALNKDKWKHRREGLSVEHIWTNADDASEVQFLFEASDLEHAREFINKVHAEARAENPDAKLPSMIFLENHDDLKLDIEFPEEEGGEKSEESKEDTSSSPSTSEVAQPIWKTATLALGGLAIGVTIGINTATCPALECPLTDTTPAPVVVTTPTTPTPRPTPTVSTPVKNEAATTSVATPTDPRPIEGTGSPPIETPTDPEAPIEPPPDGGGGTGGTP